MNAISTEEIIKNKAYHMWLLVIYLLTFLVLYGSFIFPHYGPDTYNVKYSQIQAEWFMKSGRVSGAILWQILGVLNINTVTYQSFFSFLSIVTFSIISYMTMVIIIKQKDYWPINSLVIIAVSVLLLYYNVFIVECYIYPEVLILFIIGLLCSVTSAYVFILQSGNRMVRLIIAFALLSVSINFYQALGAHFIFITFICIFIKNIDEPISKNLQQYLVSLIIYGLTGLVNIFIIKFIGQATGRAKIALVNILNNFKPIIINEFYLWLNNYELLPRFFFIMVMISFFILLIYTIRSSSIMQAWAKNRKYLEFILLVCTLKGVLIFPHLLSNGVYMAPRTITVHMALPALFTIVIAVLNSRYNKKRLRLRLNAGNVCIFVLLVYLIFNVFGVQKITIGQYATNYLDREIAKLYIDEIEKYEERTNKKVMNLSIQYDMSPTFEYDGINRVMDINTNTFSADWSIVQLINDVSGRKFNRVEIRQNIFNENFKDKDWDRYSHEQIIIIDDTAYIAIY